MAKNIEIGSGGNPQPSYIHIDAYVDNNTRHLVDIVADARSLPFNDGEIDSVLMFGVFEHFGIFEASQVLLEISRVLKVGGKFKFDVPDFDWFIHAYLTGEDRITGLKLDPNRDMNWIMHAFYGGQENEGMFHKWGWNQKRLEEFLNKPNFEFSSIEFLGRQWRDPESNHLIYECTRGERK